MKKETQIIVIIIPLFLRSADLTRLRFLRFRCLANVQQPQFRLVASFSFFLLVFLHFIIKKLVFPIWFLCSRFPYVCLFRWLLLLFKCNFYSDFDFIFLFTNVLWILSYLFNFTLTIHVIYTTDYHHFAFWFYSWTLLNFYRGINGCI